ncbi:hypothetical protein [Streptomyces sp. NPDC056191]|uniref:hypothetical protein n=1 Tax=Streptomyces sp. NPDC056191 TaxID=3345742 RepID=UPI0035E3AE62
MAEVTGLSLAAGHRYNHAISLLTEEDDIDPADLIQAAVENHLLPAFTLKPHYVGHRPWDDLFAEALDETKDEAATPVGTSLRDCGPEAHALVEPDDEPMADSTSEVASNSLTADDPAAQGDEDGPAPTASEPQQTTDAPAAGAQESESAEASVDSADAARPPASKRRPRSRTSAKTRPETTS